MESKQINRVNFKMKDQLVYIDGDYYPRNEAKVSVFDHGFLYGDGVFEGIRAYNGEVFKLDEHLDRLFESAKSIKLQAPLTKVELKEAILSTLKKNDLRDSYIRVVVTRGIGTLGLDPTKCEKPSIVIITEPLYRYLSETATAIVTSTRRNAAVALNPQIKSLNYLNNILAKVEAIQAGVTEPIMLNQEGYISEGAGVNLFMVKKGRIITPPSTAGLVVGITRNTFIELAQLEGIEVEEKNITVHELYNADEAFLTGTAAEVVPLVEVDGRRIGDGKTGLVTSKLREKFLELVKTSRS